jgi:prepilin-type N-terminal cleavage/methylation domain-containing protein
VKKQKSSAPNPSKGFTLIELLVAVATFSIVVTVAVDIFLMGLGGTQRIFGQQNIQESGRFILESISKEMRMSKINTVDGGPYTTLNITNAKNETLDYVFDNSAKQISRAGAVLNPNEVEAAGNFYVKKSGANQPRVTVVIKLKNKSAKAAAQAEINLQTTISSRQYAP